MDGELLLDLISRAQKGAEILKETRTADQLWQARAAFVRGDTVLFGICIDAIPNRRLRALADAFLAPTLRRTG
jgi:hypothetical protein